MASFLKILRSCSVRRASILCFTFANLRCFSYKPQFSLPFQTRLFSNQNDILLSHKVNDFICNEVKVVFDYNDIASITILEADADAQEQLINLALEEKSLKAEEDPYGSVLWPSAKTCSMHLLNKNLKEKTILELGTGNIMLVMMCMISKLCLLYINK